MAGRKKVLTTIDKSKRVYRRKTAVKKSELHPVELFYKALTEFYKEDRLAPGLQTAWLADKNCWYASIGRYPNISTGRHILHKAFSEISLKDAVDQVIRMWKDKVSPKRQYLDQFLGQ